MYINVSECGEGWRWAILQFGNEVANGYKKVHQEAHDAAGEALGRYVVGETPKWRERMRCQTWLKYQLGRRPYIFQYLAHYLLNREPEFSWKRIREEVADEESAFQQQDPPRFRIPIPVHHLTKSAHEVALGILRRWKMLGMVEDDAQRNFTATRKLRIWATKAFGSDFARGQVEEREVTDDQLGAPAVGGQAILPPSSAMDTEIAQLRRAERMYAASGNAESLAAVRKSLAEYGQKPEQEGVGAAAAPAAASPPPNAPAAKPVRDGARARAR